MEFEIRELKKAEELEEVIVLQAIVGGLPPKDTMSPITLSALTLERPRVGWVLGVYDEGKMVAFLVAMAAAEPGLVFGHMLGVLPKYRNSGAAQAMLDRAFALFRQSGMKRNCWTFEPLESANAHIYVKRQQGRCVHYLVDHYYIREGLHQGLPQDRFLIEKDLCASCSPDPEPLGLPELLQGYPLVTADKLSEAPAVLVEIPAQLRRLQAEDPAAALEWRLGTRKIFLAYINQRGYVADDFFSGELDGRRRSFYRLSRPS